MEKKTMEGETFPTIAVILPALNEERTIGALISELKRDFAKIVVVDDGSADSTAKKAREAGAVVIRHNRNLGKGSALRSGILHVSGDDAVEAILVMDADGQHHPEDAKRFAELWREKKPECLLGARSFDARQMPSSRIFWNHVISKLLSFTTEKKIPDSQCGLRLYSRRLFSKVMPDTGGYVADTEMLILAMEAGADVVSIPIRTIYDPRKQLRFFNDMRRALAISFFVMMLLAKRRFRAILFVGLLLTFWVSSAMLIRRDITIAKSNYANPQIEGAGYVAAMKFLAEHSPKDAIVISEWTQGHQVVALAGRRAVATTKVYPSEAKELAERFRDIGKFFFATSPGEIKEVLDKYGASFIFLRKKNFDFYICEYHNRCGKPEALIYKLLAGEAVPFLETVYETDWYKILKRIDGFSPAMHYAGFGLSYDYFLSEFKKIDAVDKIAGGTRVIGGIIPHHYPFTDAFFPEFFSKVRKAEPSVVVLIGPDHREQGRAAITFSNRAWITPFGKMEPDVFRIDKLQKAFGAMDEKVHSTEWSLKAVITYAEFVVPNAKIIPILMRSDVRQDDARNLGVALSQVLPKDALLILSADFSHRLSAEETEKRDRQSVSVINALDVESAAEQEIDSRPGLVALLSFLKEDGAAAAELLGYATSQSLHKKEPQRFPSYSYIVSYFSYVFEKQ